MPFFSRGPSIPSGWVAAPGAVRQEIFLVWQEDELPDELKNAPGYVPFTLSPESETWVRGMAEIKEIDGDKEKIVIGRPRPAASVQHRPLIQEPVAPAPAPSWTANAAPAPVPAWDSGIAAKEWIRRQAPRDAPAIAVRTQTAASTDQDRDRVDRPAARSLPSIGGTARSEPTPAVRPPNQARAFPDIDSSSGGESPPAARPENRARALPDIGSSSGEEPPPAAGETQSHREKPRRIPDIGPP
jgi:hypothetical protein